MGAGILWRDDVLNKERAAGPQRERLCFGQRGRVQSPTHPVGFREPEKQVCFKSRRAFSVLLEGRVVRDRDAPTAVGPLLPASGSHGVHLEISPTPLPQASQVLGLGWHHLFLKVFGCF